MVKEVYKETRNFQKEELYGLTNQIRRSAISIPSNISEGHLRQHRSEFIQFMSIALGSLAELETQILIGKELGYISNERTEYLIDQMNSMGKMIRGLMKKLTKLRSITDP